MAAAQPGMDIAAMAKKGLGTYLSTARRNKWDHIYTTLEDFTRTEPARKRLVVIGCTGSGKSTLLNVMAGWHFKQSKETDWEFKWQPKASQGEDDPPIDPIFVTASSSDSVTKLTGFANVHMRGDLERELLVVDTPGHDDPAGCDLDSQEARETLGELAADLHNKGGPPFCIPSISKPFSCAEWASLRDANCTQLPHLGRLMRFAA